jgi:hypothetical protein
VRYGWQLGVSGIDGTDASGDPAQHLEPLGVGLGRLVT